MIGRKRESLILKDHYELPSSSFISVTGRRGVGKTYFLENIFQDKIFFKFNGETGLDNRDQLMNFANALNVKDTFKDWQEAFMGLESNIQKSELQKKIVIIDEISWIGQESKEFIQFLERFWNIFSRQRSDVLLIICGSAVAWIHDNIFNTKGGFHNRITGYIRLEPFTLLEIEEYLIIKNYKLTRKQICNLYMVLGGVPYYYDLLPESNDIIYCINYLFFKEDSPLRNELENLFSSLFVNPRSYLEVFRALSKQTRGLTREEIIESGTLSNGGALSKILEDLRVSNFIQEYGRVGNSKKGVVYQLIDNLTIFCLTFADRISSKESSWIDYQNIDTTHIWYDFAFERLCYLHLKNIMECLEIKSKVIRYSNYRSDNTHIDLVLECIDNTAYIIEMRYDSKPFSITKEYYAKLLNKITVMTDFYKNTKTIIPIVITSNGVSKSPYNLQNAKYINLNALFYKLNNESAFGIIEE